MSISSDFLLLLSICLSVWKITQNSVNGCQCIFFEMVERSPKLDCSGTANHSPDPELTLNIKHQL